MLWRKKEINCLGNLHSGRRKKEKKKVRHRCIDSKQVKIVKLINVGTSHKVNLFINILKNHNKNLIGSIHIHKIKGNL